MKPTSLKYACLFLLAATACPSLHADAALEYENEVRRQQNQHQRDTQERHLDNQNSQIQSIENQQFNREVDASDSLVIPVPEPLWNETPGE